MTARLPSASPVGKADLLRFRPRFGRIFPCRDPVAARRLTAPQPCRRNWRLERADGLATRRQTEANRAARDLCRACSRFRPDCPDSGPQRTRGGDGAFTVIAPARESAVLNRGRTSPSEAGSLRTQWPTIGFARAAGRLAVQAFDSPTPRAAACHSSAPVRRLRPAIPLRRLLCQRAWPIDHCFWGFMAGPGPLTTQGRGAAGVVISSQIGYTARVADCGGVEAGGLRAGSLTEPKMLSRKMAATAFVSVAI